MDKRMNPLYEQLNEHLERSVAFTTALTLFEWDTETLAPEAASDQTSKIVGILSEEYFKSIINDEVKGLLEQLEEKDQFNSLEQEQQAVVKQLRKLYGELAVIPREEYREYSELIAKSVIEWSDAREHDAFSEFVPTLKKIVAFKNKFANYRKTENQAIYDVLLEDYEPGFSMAQLDSFFDLLKQEIVPLLHSVKEEQSQICKDYNYESYDINGQRDFNYWLAGYVGFDYEKGVISESAHPFTTDLHNKDVRITNHYYEHNLESAIFSTIHEVGHAIYEMNIDDKISQTIIGAGASMGLHESQSRFYENIIGKNEAFWRPIYVRLQETFPEQLEKITLEAFLRGVRKVEPSLIRVDADELTYPLHILIRYEVEKMIFDGTVDMEDLPAIWNEKYEEYLGITPTSYADGILQDIHWACGDFGYFSSYAIGSAVAAQLYFYLREHYPFEQWLQEGKIPNITELLKEHIHKYGMMKTTNELLLQMTGEEFNPKYYIDYLKEVYQK